MKNNNKSSEIKNFLLVPDSFKGTLSSTEICDIMSKEINKVYSSANIISIPIADGGEGTVDSFLSATKGEKITCSVKGPYFEDVSADFAIVNDGNTAVIEMAQCSGLPYVEKIGKKDPSKTTTFGVGQLILSALDNGCKTIILGLGGSCTNDGGCGCLSALGIKFIDEDGNSFIPVGGTLNKIESVDCSSLDNRINSTSIRIMCDIDNPMYGENGAAYVYGMQKGADEKMIKFLDTNLKHLSDIIEKSTGKNISAIPGTGAAGAMGAGIYAYLHGKIENGIDIILDEVHFDKLLENADLVFTGEGRFDQQSLRGKAVIGVSRRAKKKDVPVIAVVGDIGNNIEDAYTQGISAVFSINRVAVPFEIAKTRAKEDLQLTVAEILRAINIIG